MENGKSRDRLVQIIIYPTEQPKFDRDNIEQLQYN